jgi:hypothetical protein
LAPSCQDTKSNCELLPRFSAAEPTAGRGIPAQLQNGRFKEFCRQPDTSIAERAASCRPQRLTGRNAGYSLMSICTAFRLKAWRKN